jgi:hypothetical protein
MPFLAFDDVGKDVAIHVSTITVDGLVEELKRLHRETSWYEQMVDVPALIRIQRSRQVILATLTAAGVEGPQLNLDKEEAKASTTTLIYIGKRWWVVNHTW